MRAVFRLLLAGLGVSGLAASVRALDAERTRLGIAPAPGTLPPVQAVLLGGFRGLYADFLWYEAETRFEAAVPTLHDLPLLYDLIAALQPRYLGMWYYTADRMAVDAPNHVPYPSPESDWRWASRGLTHLERGLKANAGDPGLHELQFRLADLYHRRCSPNRYARWGAHAHRRLAEERGENSFDRAVALVHAMRDAEDALPARLAKAAHVRADQALAAPTLEAEAEALTRCREEWRWMRDFYRDPAPRNRYLRQDPAIGPRSAERLAAQVLPPLDLKLEALAHEREGRTAEALGLWRLLMRDSLLRVRNVDPLARKHLRAAGTLTAVYEELANDLEKQPAMIPDEARRHELVQALRQAAAAERERPRA